MRLLPGAAPQAASVEIGRQVEALSAVEGRRTTSEEMLGAYLRWAIEAERMLRSHFRSDDVAGQLFTHRYWSLQSPAPANRDLIPLLVQAGVAEQRERLSHEQNRLVDALQRWRQGGLLVPDTSTLIHGTKLWEWDPADEFDLGDKPVRLILPMLVIDELDDLKESTKAHTRHRARESLKWIAEQFGGSMHPALIHEGGARVNRFGLDRQRGSLHIDLFLDEPGHRRLPIADDEVVDRAGLVASLSGREVALVTNDFGQAHRARLAGLGVFMVEAPTFEIDLQEKARVAKREVKDAQRRAQGQRPTSEEDSEVAPHSADAPR